MSKITRLHAENMRCSDCGMKVEPAGAFHPGLYCWLFKAGIKDPEKWLKGYGFIPDPALWTTTKGGPQPRQHPSVGMQ